MPSAVEDSRETAVSGLPGVFAVFTRPVALGVVVATVAWHLALRRELDVWLLVAAVITGLLHWFRFTIPTDAPHSYGLPGMREGPATIWAVPPKAHLVLAQVSLAAFAAGSLLLVPGIVLLAVVAVLALAWLVSIAPVLQRRRQLRRLVAALRAYAPQIGIGFAGRGGASWQLKMWEPYLVRSGLPCVVFTRNRSHLRVIREGADLASPLIQLSPDGRDDLRSLLVPSLRTLYYVQNAKWNAEFMRHRHITHVWLNHGDSDKPANFNERHADYDKLVVCGQAGIDRYSRHGIDVAPEKFVMIGRPQTAGVRAATRPIAEKDKPVVLYAPTWQGVDDSVNFSSLEVGAEIVRSLIARDVTVIFRPHPLSLRWRGWRAVARGIWKILREDREKSGRRHVWGKRAGTKWSVVDCFNHADALISDVSSVVSDFLQSEKPYAMVSMHVPVEEFRTEFSVAETGYVILGDLSNLDSVLDEMLGSDPLEAARREHKRYVLGDFVGEESAEAFAELVRELAGGS